MTAKNIDLISKIVMAAGALVAAAFMLHSSNLFDAPFNMQTLSNIGFVAIFVLWGATPFIFYHRLCRAEPADIAKLVYIITSVLSIIFAAYTYYDSMYINVDAQGALIFIFLPLYLNFVCMTVWAVTTIVKAVSHR